LIPAHGQNDAAKPGPEIRQIVARARIAMTSDATVICHSVSRGLAVSHDRPFR